VKVIANENISEQDVILMKDDNTYEIYDINDLILAKNEISKIIYDELDNSIEIEKSDEAWNILKTLYEKGYIDAKEILKEQLKKIVEDKDITEIFNELIWNWKNEGDANTDKITQIIDTCRRRNGDDTIS